MRSGLLRVMGSRPDRVIDLGSGGGVPALVLALVWSQTEFTLLDSMVKRCVFLREVAANPAFGGRLKVVEGRAESAARESGHRGTYDLVTARSFGGPAVTAECAAGFLRVQGRLIVSEPPEGSGRWTGPGLEALGLQFEASVDGVAIMRQVRRCDDRYPRRPGIPAKRPLF